MADTLRICPPCYILLNKRQTVIVFIISVLVAALCWTAADRLKESVKKDQNWIDFLNSMSVDELDKFLKK